MMNWLHFLPSVPDEIAGRRDKISARIAQAERLEREAAELRAIAAQERSELVDRLAAKFPVEEIKRAVDRTEPAFSAFSLAHVKDERLRNALRVLDKRGSAHDLLDAYRLGGVVRQHNLMTTATPEEHRETISRLLDWWNYGVTPYLWRMEGGAR